MLTGSCHCGAVHWTLEGDPGPVTACNCTLCRRYGALWAYDYENERIRISGPTKAYTRVGKADPALEIHFCPTCACVVCWRGLRLETDGRRRIAVNIRLAPPKKLLNSSSTTSTAWTRSTTSRATAAASVISGSKSDRSAPSQIETHVTVGGSTVYQKHTLW